MQFWIQLESFLDIAKIFELIFKEFGKKNCSSKMKPFEYSFLI